METSPSDCPGLLSNRALGEGKICLALGHEAVKNSDVPLIE